MSKIDWTVCSACGQQVTTHGDETVASLRELQFSPREIIFLHTGCKSERRAVKAPAQAPAGISNRSILPGR